ncbi:core-2/I-Branching enzyme domain-containing protein [Ditylenchus destructor]|nr:core-2/I-Branching enzyme domain-containing protein [Ditylenchus destructor]
MTDEDGDDEAEEDHRLLNVSTSNRNRRNLPPYFLHLNSVRCCSIPKVCGTQNCRDSAIVMPFSLGFMAGITMCLILLLIIFRPPFSYSSFLLSRENAKSNAEDDEQAWLERIVELRDKEIQQQTLKVEDIEQKATKTLTLSTVPTPTLRRLFAWPSDLIPQIECARLFDSDESVRTSYLKKIGGENRFTYDEDKDNQKPLDMSCKAIRQRHYFAEQPMSQEEADFPIAYARIVYRDYRFLETEFATEFTPQNVFCFAIDEKAPKLFHERIGSLAKCFPKNVIITKHEYSVDSAGHNMGYSHLQCFRRLIEFDKSWKYVFNLQNHDLQLRTNQELVQILKWFNSANDVEVYPPPNNRVDWNMNWTLANLHIFRNETLNRMSENSLNSNGTHNSSALSMNLAKGLVESTLSRPAIEYMLNQLDLTQFMKQLETNRYGIDELWLPSLQATDDLHLPGGFTSECLRRGISTGSVTRYTLWYDSKNCGSGHMRHNLCVFGVEDLAKTAQLPHLFLNKFMPTIDFGASLCWHEFMYNRTYLDRGVHRLLPELYQTLPHVRFQSEKATLGDDFSKFNCTYTAYNLLHSKK